MNLCQRFGHAWTSVTSEDQVRRCSRCPRKQHRAPGGPWVDLRKDHAAVVRATPQGQLSFFESQKGV